MSDTSISGNSRANWDKIGAGGLAGAAIGIKEIDSASTSVTKVKKNSSDTANSTGNTQDNAQMSKLGKAAAIIGGFSEINPAQVVDEIRNSQGATRDNLLVGFQNKLSKMDTGDLKEVRDYLVKEMASPTNKDDELLGVLAKAVNKEIDSRQDHSIKEIPHIFDKFPSTTFPLEKGHTFPINDKNISPVNKKDDTCIVKELGEMKNTQDKLGDFKVKF